MQLTSTEFQGNKKNRIHNDDENKQVSETGSPVTHMELFIRIL